MSDQAKLFSPLAAIKHKQPLQASFCLACWSPFPAHALAPFPGLHSCFKTTQIHLPFRKILLSRITIETHAKANYPMDKMASSKWPMCNGYAPAITETPRHNELHTGGDTSTKALRGSGAACTLVPSAPSPAAPPYGSAVAACS